MKKIHRNMLITAGGLILAGAALGAAGLLIGAGSSDPVSYLTEKIDSQSISIYSGNDDIKIERSDGEDITISYPDNRECVKADENGKIGFRFINKAFDISEWYKHIDISFKEEETAVILRLPLGFKGEISAQSAVADIYVCNIEANNVILESRNGDVTLENSICDINAKSETGDVRISGKGKSAEAESEHGGVEITDSEYDIVSADSENGDIEMLNVFAGAIYMNNSSGEISGKEIESGSVDIINEYGDIMLYKFKPGMTRVENRYGDIRLTLIGNKGDYSVNGSSEAKNRVYVNSEYGDTYVEYIPE